MCAIACARFVAGAGVDFCKPFLIAEVQVANGVHSSRGSILLEGT